MTGSQHPLHPIVCVLTALQEKSESHDQCVLECGASCGCMEDLHVKLYPHILDKLPFTTKGAVTLCAKQLTCTVLGV